MSMKHNPIKRYVQFDKAKSRSLLNKFQDTFVTRKLGCICVSKVRYEKIVEARNEWI